MLAKVEGYNVEAEKIKKEGREKLNLKMRCKRDHHQAGCEKLWQLKNDMSEDQDDEGYGGGCKDDKDEETVRCRIDSMRQTLRCTWMEG